MERTREAAVGALLGTFAGDAVGAPWEGSEPVAGRSASGRVQGSLDRGELRYTDDTQLTLALAEHLCEHPGVDQDALARTFLDHHEPGRGYGGGMLRLLDIWRSGTPVDEAATAVFPDGSFGNGAAMRVAPVGVVWAHDPRRLEAVARRQASVTHAHRLGQAAAALQARAVGVAAGRGTFGPDELEALDDVVAEPELRAPFDEARALTSGWEGDADLSFAEIARRVGNEVVGHRSVPGALWAAAAGSSFPEVVELAIGLGGDADTLAAMAGAVAGAAAGRDAIPESWQERFEDGLRGRGFALRLAERLAEVDVR
ncbi:MAG: ADP-ribosylglycohydrolase family protein [Actinobacteria bacterium]|nr:ADP-ribosylglycohydrolase family protein [Actinomycetota bacterium]